MWSNISEANKCTNIDYGIKATNKVFNEGRRFFLFKLLKQVMKS